MSGARRWIRGIVVALAALAALLAAGGAVLLHTHAPAPVDPAWAVAGGGAAPPGSVTVRWTGTSTLVFSDGETTWLTDGWFSRPGPLRLLLGQIAPDLDAIERGLARNGVERAAAVFALHSHFDHAMDAPEVARRTGALLVGSESTANVGRGWGLDESRIRVVRDRETLRLGRFVLTPVASRHFEFPDPRVRERALGDPEITEPLVPPASAFDYKVGVAWVLHVLHPRGTFLVVGSAGWEEGALDGFDADVVFLGVGGLGSQTDAYRETFWRETVGATRPARVIPIHWDSLTGPIEGPFTGPARIESFLARGAERGLAFLRAKQAENPGIEFATLPRYEPVAVFPAAP